MSSTFSIRWVVALKAEAEPLIDHFKLKIIHGITPFNVYKSQVEDIWLIISGIGSINSAAASIFLYQLSRANQSSFWFNIGVAGHFIGPIGKIYLVDKIVDSSSGLSHFPRPALRTKIERSQLLTVSKPMLKINPNTLVDMEGYSFYDVVNRVAFREMIAILKVVSDVEGTDYTQLTKISIRNYISDVLPQIINLASEAIELSKYQIRQIKEPSSYKKIIMKKHFSSTQKIIFKKLANDWQRIFPEDSLTASLSHLSTAAEMIEKLKVEISSYKIDWLDK